MAFSFLSPPAFVAAILLTGSAIAQPGSPTPSVPAATPAPGMASPSVDPVDALGRYLRVLAIFPKNLDALTGAGRAALAIGDANAAISFFARAQEIAPGDGRIKAGLASALVQMEQPKTALKLFDQAVALGVPEADVASDRGLARDLRGDTRRAQQDYALALRTRPDDETIRRLAVSQAISGDRAAAAATLDPLLRRQDRAAWRVHAFVLALTGDRDGAEQAALATLPRPQAQALTPFFARLAALHPGEKAAAVNLGQLPSDGRRYSDPELFAQADVAASPAPLPAGPPAPRSDVPLIPAGQPLGAAPADEALSRAPRRRPGTDASPPPTQLAAATPPRPPAAPILKVAAAPRPLAIVAAAPPPTVPQRPAPLAPLPSPAPLMIAAAPAPIVMLAPPPPVAAAPPGAGRASAGVGAPIVETRFGPALVEAVPPAEAPAAAMQLAAAEPARVPVAAPAAETRIAAPAGAAAKAEPVATVEYPVGIAPRQVRVNGGDKAAAPAPPSARGKTAPAKAGKAEDAPAAAKLAGKGRAGDAKDKPATKGRTATAKEDKPVVKEDKPAEKASGERYWVQVGSGANKADLGRAWDKTKARAPKLLDARAPWTAPWKQSNRLLVGPFKSADEAQGFVNMLGKAGMGGIQFTSRAGTRVEKLPGK